MADVTQSAVSYGYSAVIQPYMPVFYVSFLVTIILTPLMRRLAHHHGVVDDPDNKRKVHTKPIAYLGGISIFLGWLAGVSVSVFMHPHNNSNATVQIPIGILMGAFAVVIFGFLDDVYSLSPKMKLVGQFLAGLCMLLPEIVPMGSHDTDFLISAGKGPAWMILIDFMNLGYFHGIIQIDHLPHWILLSAPIASGIIAVALIVATCNATNLLDGLDGLCSGVTGVMSLGYLILAIYLAKEGVSQGQALDPVRISLSLALLGAVMGFLP
ncbi:MAG TPA: MraY family glycosyltransferase, partial [Phycisphaerae bacterium]